MAGSPLIVSYQMCYGHRCILMVGNSWPRMSAIGSEEALTWIKGTFTQVPTTFPGWNLNNSKVIFHSGSPNLCQDSPSAQHSRS